MLDLEIIKSQVADPDIGIEILKEIDSTNSYLKRMKNLERKTICFAETQTQGRGSRENRKWYSPFAQNIYMSYAYPFKKKISELEGLSLVISMAILSAIKEIEVHENIMLKWPNDGLFEGKKLMGNLIETKIIDSYQTLAIIGIGINVNMLEAKEGDISQDWTSLRMISGKYIDRNSFSIALIHNLNSHLESFNKYGLRDTLLNWKKVDHLYNKIIKLNNGELMGVAKGLNEQGHLLIEFANGDIKSYSSAEVFICKDNQ